MEERRLCKPEAAGSIPVRPDQLAPGIEARPVLDHLGHVVLFDLWLAGRWVGSRRTAEQCADHLTYLTGIEIEATPGTPW